MYKVDFSGCKILIYPGTRNPKDRIIHPLHFKRYQQIEMFTEYYAHQGVLTEIN